MTPPAPSTAPADHRRAFAAGLVLAASLGIVAMSLARLPQLAQLGFSPLTIAILLGMVLGNSVFPRIATRTAPGVDFARTLLLRAGIVLYGLRITAGDLAAIGWSGALIDALMIGLTFSAAVLIGTRVLRIDRQTAMLIGTGSAICGAAAVLAAEPIVRGQAHRVSVAIATVVVFGTISMFLYPLLYPHLGLTPHAFGVYVGSTVHEVAQVVAAGRSVGEAAAAPAVIEKMLRVMMLAPFLMLLSAWVRPTEGAEGAAGVQPVRRFVVPWFAVLFIMVGAFNSLHLLPAPVVDTLVTADTLLLTMAMSALGLRTHASALRQAGVRPLWLGASLNLFLVLVGYGVNRAIGALF